MANIPFAQELQLNKIKQVGTALSVDFVAGFAASLLVSPAVAIIDKAIVTNASGKESFNQGLKSMTTLLLSRPHQFIRQPYFFPVFCIFGGTYAVVSKLSGTICFLISSGVNVALNGWKDSLFTRWYATVAPKPLPKLTLGLFAIRDSMTIGAPCAVQLLSTKIHLYALDMYNFPGLSMKEHFSLIRKNYWKTSMGRIVRTLPGFGIGGDMANIKH
ncbi:hypothetical protein BCR33DRAFT_712998 [Rhizoclosmatium globosum]|uniref:Uncharacterized protein n=1 Tax=Rhizoclosmatium globosum TaxID=329046 RepID=A0A1Y2CVN0_9FUNG|nr:hypothetical protein BCR33DRAFT_712998 [Rhizoclosmatium globosum]|eukprot:ORY51078.1 hypothetical protein BCR33DRAFT_712998 [Rhizoclosmatium globosum]